MRQQDSLHEIFRFDREARRTAESSLRTLLRLATAQRRVCRADSRGLRERSSSLAPRASMAEASAWRRSLWRQPLLSQISSTRGPAWGGLRVDVPRGPKRSRGANCLYQEVHERANEASPLHGPQAFVVDGDHSDAISSRSTPRRGLPAGLRSPRPET